MRARFALALLALCRGGPLLMVRAACETEEDLDFEACDLKDLKDEVLKEICNRIGLDMEGHVLPFLLEEDENDEDASAPPTDEGGEKSDEEPKSKTTFTHDEYVRGAEECLLVESEMAQLEEEDPDYLRELEREALREDPETVAEVVADVLRQDQTLAKEIAAKVEKDAPEAFKEVAEMLGEGEKLEDRADVIGWVVAKLLLEGEDLEFLDEFDDMLSEILLMDEEWGDESVNDIGDGDEL
ncbi:hypothetical protein ACHAWF_007236 [Thalassiosira exigua]